MSNPYTPAHRAQGRIKLGIARLAGHYPFHAKVLERLRLVATPSVGTLGVTISADQLLLLYAPEFILSLPIDQLGGVLLHEVHHVVLGHLTLDPKQYPDAWALTTALELSANEFVREPLPAGAITLTQFPMLPPLESSAQRYQRLCATRPQGDASGLPPESGGGAGASTLDNHDVWDDIRGNLQATREILAELVQQAALEAGGIPPDLQDAIQGAGMTSATGVQILQGDHPASLDWRRV